MFVFFAFTKCQVTLLQKYHPNFSISMPSKFGCFFVLKLSFPHNLGGMSLVLNEGNIAVLKSNKEGEKRDS